MDDTNDAEYPDPDYDGEDWMTNEEDDLDFENICDCGERGTDICTICGNPMCFRCFEVKCGVCDDQAGAHEQCIFEIEQRIENCELPF